MKKETKKTIYIAMTIFLGWLLSVIAHGWIELWYIHTRLAEGVIPRSYHFLNGDCYLNPMLQVGLCLIGLVGGYFMGRSWWRIVYVENRFGWIKRKK